MGLSLLLPLIYLALLLWEKGKGNVREEGKSIIWSQARRAPAGEQAAEPLACPDQLQPLSTPQPQNRSWVKAPEVLNGCEVLVQQKLVKYPGKGQELQGVSCPFWYFQEASA